MYSPVNAKEKGPLLAGDFELCCFKVSSGFLDIKLHNEKGKLIGKAVQSRLHCRETAPLSYMPIRLPCLSTIMFITATIIYILSLYLDLTQSSKLCLDCTSPDEV